MEEIQLNEKFLYAFSSLRKYPIIKMEYQGNNSYVCPLPQLLYERLTSGIYYELYEHPLFDNTFGESYQSYIGDVFKRGCPSHKCLPDEEYKVGKHKKRTVDFIVFDKEKALFVECKTKRLTYKAKSELLSKDELERQIDKMADFIIQTYKSIADYEKGYYPQFKFISSLRVYPVIVTLEDWFLYMDMQVQLLEEKIKYKLQQNSLSEDILDRMPYLICSTEEIETLAQLINKYGIGITLDKKLNDKTYKMWLLRSYMREFFENDINNDVKDLFEDDFSNEISNWEKRIKKTSKT